MTRVIIYLYANATFLNQNHLAQPAAVRISQQLRARGIALDPALTLTELASQLAPLLGGKRNE